MENYPPIDTFPTVITMALLIILVKAVYINFVGVDNGQQFSWSFRGSLLAVSALEKGEYLGEMATGTALTIVYTARLVAYLLSL